MTKKISDYAEIIGVYNTSGRKEACTFIREQYSIKNPYAVIKRMKESERYSYDKESDCFLRDSACEAEHVFMGLDELCHLTTIQKQSMQALCISMDKLVKTLIEDRLLMLSRYIQMNQASKTVLVDQTAMVTDGYHVTVH